MSTFACVAGPAAPGEAERRLRRTSAGSAARTVAREDDFQAAAGPAFLRPLHARRAHLTAVGDVRLENRAEVLAAVSSRLGPAASDLEVVLAGWDARGERIIPLLVGEFAFAVWDARGRCLTSARDALGVRPLFHGRAGDALVVASRLEAVTGGAVLDAAFAADFFCLGAAAGERTPWADASAVPPGGMLVHRGGRTTVRRWWRAEDFVPAAHADERAAVEEFGERFRAAVAGALTGGGDCWAQLSGGLDSSSIVCTAQALARGGGAAAGVAGTLTVADALGDGDETRFSSAVARRWGVRNEVLGNAWPWQDDGTPPTATDEPRPHFPFWARDRRLCELVRAAGGRVLLSGQGSDHYLDPPLTWLADLAAQGGVREAARHATRHAVERRESFYSTFGRHALLPLLPAPLARRLGGDAPPAWLRPELVAKSEVESRLPAARRARAPRGGKLRAELADGLLALAGLLEREPWNEGLEMRYPFLNRPLVELSLRLPVALRGRPGRSKWVLREAMRGVLPHEVRDRRGKGGIDSRVLWAFQREAPRLAALLRDPLVAQQGWVDADALRAACERARVGETQVLPQLLSTLSLETWLVVRSGRWAPLDARKSSAASAA